MTAQNSGLTMAITSSTALVGVALAQKGTVLASQDIIADRRHAEEITPMIKRVLEKADCHLSEVQQFVADIGPGRFTGMRVGLATVKTLAYATGAPVIPVTSFQMLWERHPGDVVAVIDARRNEVFVQHRSASGEISDPSIATPAGLAERLTALGGAPMLMGDGADRYAEVLRDHNIFLDQHPDCAAIASNPPAVAPQPADQIRPLYLRDADVQINIKTRPQT